MAYNNFTLDSVKNQFKLKLSDYPVCEALPPAEPASDILSVLDRWFPIASIARTEKAKSELLVSPVLTENFRYSQMDAESVVY